MTKYSIIRKIFEDLGAIFVFEEYFGTDLADSKEEEFIVLISGDKYLIEEFTGLSLVKTRELVKRIFPDKPQGSNQKLDRWILTKYGYNYCRMCDSVKSITEFSYNKSKSGGLNYQCKTCQKKQTVVTQAARQAKYRAAGLNAIVPWTDLEVISEFYSKCPIGYQVDHIVPLQGNKVSGLHVLDNLQYLIEFENKSKHNKYIAG